MVNVASSNLVRYTQMCNVNTQIKMRLFTTAYVTHITHDVTEVVVATASSSDSGVDRHVIIRSY
jgi:hypothetical protein